MHGRVGKTNMNKHRGQDIDEYLKERGIFEEVDALTQKELAALRSDEPLKSGDAYEITEDLPNRITRFFQWLRHAFKQSNLL